MTREQASKLSVQIWIQIKKLEIKDMKVIVMDASPNSTDGDCDIQIVPSNE